MSDKATPEKGASPPGVIDFGEGFIADFSDFIAKEGTEPIEEAEEQVEGNTDNVTLEGEELSKAEPEVAIPVKDKPAEPEKAAEPEPEPPKSEPDVYEFDIKYRGETMTEKLTKEQLIARIQMAKDYSVKTEELKQKNREVDAIRKLSETEWFKTTYEEALQTGAIEAPPPPPPADPEDVYEYGRRQRDEDFEEVRTAMREYSLALPPEEQEILASNHRIFNREYDRFAAQVRKAKQPPPTPQVDPEVAKKILKSKEANKANAVIEKPGVGSPEVDPNINKRKQLAAIHRDAKAGKHDAITKLAYYAMYNELPDF